MADTLGLHVDPAGITAARVDTSTDAPPVVVPLGADGPSDDCVVVHTDDGTVLVGRAAQDATGTRVTDPMTEAATGRIGPLGAVVNHVVGLSLIHI